MKLYLNSTDYLEKFNSFIIADKIEDADVVLILPGGLGTFYDLFKAINMNKKIFLYNENFFYTPLIKNLYDLYLKGVIEKVPSDYINIESEFDKILEKIEEMK